MRKAPLVDDSMEEIDVPANVVRRRTGGRSARVREAVLQATLEGLGELGPGDLTFSEIARRSGVHATSIQRRWGSRENVILEALMAASNERIPVPNTGNLRGDLLRLARSLAIYVTGPLGEGVVRMMAASQDDAVLAANRAEFFRMRYAASRVIFDRAAARGEFRAGADTHLAVELLSAPIYFRLLVTRQPIDEPFIEQMIDMLLRGLRQNPKPKRQR